MLRLPDIFSTPQLDYIVFQLVLFDKDTGQATEVEVQPLVVLPSDVQYVYPSRVGIAQTGMSGFKDEGGLGLIKIILRGSFGHEVRRVGLSLMDGWTRLRNFRERIFKMSHTLNATGKRNEILCLNFYDFVHDEQFAISLDNFTIVASTRHNRLPKYTLPMTAIGKPIDTISYDPTLTALLAATEVLNTIMDTANLLMNSLLETAFMKALATGIAYLSVGWGITQATWSMLKTYFQGALVEWNKVKRLGPHVEAAFKGRTKGSKKRGFTDTTETIQTINDNEADLIEGHEEEILTAKTTGFDTHIDEARQQLGYLMAAMTRLDADLNLSNLSDEPLNLSDSERPDIDEVLYLISAFNDQLKQLRTIHRFFKIDEQTKQNLFTYYEQGEVGTKPITSRQHDVTEFDTWESISLMYSMAWQDIAEFNDMDANDLTPGTTIEIPLIFDPEIARNVIDDNPVFDSHRGIYVLGRDCPNELVVDDETGDLKVLCHRETFLQGLMNILTTDPGDIPLHPTFGFLSQIGEAYPSDIRPEMIKLRFKQALERDPRVLEVPKEKIVVEMVDEGCKATGEVIPVNELSYEELTYAQ